MCQIFAETNRAFEKLKKAKTYRTLSIIYAVIGVSLMALMTLQMHPCFLICGLVSLSTAGFYFRKASELNREVLDLAECNICLLDDGISVHQAAKGKYETFNVYYSEINNITVEKHTPAYYIIMKDKSDLKDMSEFKSSYYIDGQRVEDFSVINVEGGDYELADFRHSFEDLMEKSHMEKIPVDGKENEALWRLKKGICDKIVPIFLLVIPMVVYYTVVFLFGGAA